MLPGTWLLTALQPMASLTAARGRRARFCNLGRLWKIDAAIMGSWCRVLARVTGSTLRLQRLDASPLLDLARVDLLRAENATENMLHWWTHNCPAVSVRRILLQPVIEGAPQSDFLCAARFVDCRGRC